MKFGDVGPTKQQPSSGKTTRQGGTSHPQTTRGTSLVLEVVWFVGVYSCTAVCRFSSTTCSTIADSLGWSWLRDLWDAKKRFQAIKCLWNGKQWGDPRPSQVGQRFLRNVLPPFDAPFTELNGFFMKRFLGSICTKRTSCFHVNSRSSSSAPKSLRCLFAHDQQCEWNFCEVWLHLSVVWWILWVRSCLEWKVEAKCCKSQGCCVYSFPKYPAAMFHLIQCARSEHRNICRSSDWIREKSLLAMMVRTNSGKLLRVTNISMPEGLQTSSPNSSTSPLLSKSLLFQDVASASRPVWRGNNVHVIGWFSNWNCWINFLRFVSCCWTVDWNMSHTLWSMLLLRFSTATVWCALIVWEIYWFFTKLILLPTSRIPVLYNGRESWRLACFVVQLFSSLHACCFLNTNRKQCVVESDCVWSCWVNLQSSLLNKFEIASIRCILKRLQALSYGTILGSSKLHRASSILWSSSIWFAAVKNTDCLSHWDTFLLGSIHFWFSNVFYKHSRCFLHSVKSSGNRTFILQWRIHNTSFWMSWNCFEIPEVFGRVWVQTLLKTFLLK